MEGHTCRRKGHYAVWLQMCLNAERKRRSLCVFMFVTPRTLMARLLYDFFLPYSLNFIFLYTMVYLMYHAFDKILRRNEFYASFILQQILQFSIIILRILLQVYSYFFYDYYKTFITTIHTTPRAYLTTQKAYIHILYENKNLAPQHFYWKPMRRKRPSRGTRAQIKLTQSNLPFTTRFPSLHTEFIFNLARPP